MGDRGSIKVVSTDAWGKGRDAVSAVLFRDRMGPREALIALCKQTKRDFIQERRSGPYNQVGEIFARMVKIAVEQDGYSSYVGRTQRDGDDSNNGHFVLYVNRRAEDDWVLKHVREGREVTVATIRGVAGVVTELCECGEPARPGTAYCPSCEADIRDATENGGDPRD